MRIIGGIYKGIIIHPPKGLPVRPTTDKAKESLFNILETRINLENLTVLDLFAGTGNMTYEFASRGAVSVEAVDLSPKCADFIKATAARLKMDMVKTIRKDAFAFLKSSISKYDLIFADAPYAHKSVIDLPGLVWEKSLLSDNGLLIVEHEARLDLTHETGYFDKRTYGQSAFSFFRK